MNSPALRGNFETLYTNFDDFELRLCPLELFQELGCADVDYTAEVILPDIRVTRTARGYVWEGDLYLQSPDILQVSEGQVELWHRSIRGKTMDESVPSV